MTQKAEQPTAHKQRLSKQLTTVAQCPHCGVSNPVMMQCWISSDPIPRADSGRPSRWGVYRCTTCGHLVSAKGSPIDNVANPIVVEYFPPIWAPSETLPPRVSHYLSQARSTLANPDASVVMSASAIDAMLKDNGLKEGALYARIRQAVTAGILTNRMANWAHRVRLDANNTRHADEEIPHMSRDDAQRAFEFAEALSDFLYVLPSKMPPEV